MTVPAAPITPSRARGALPSPSTKQSAPPSPPAPKPTGIDAAALAELRNAAATYDYLASKGEPVEFWETLRLARNRRSLQASASMEVQVSADDDAIIRNELHSIRRHCSSMVRNLRTYLKGVPGLPEPADRLEMAMAFLLASTREHQRVAQWLAEPGKHEAKASEKLRSLASITDPYREALRPWALQTSAAPATEADLYGSIDAHVTEATPAPGAVAAPPPRPAPAASAAPPDSPQVASLRLALQCREIFAGIHLESELWETVLLADLSPEKTRAAVDQLIRDLEGDRLEEFQTRAEALFRQVTELRKDYARRVGFLRGYLRSRSKASDDPRTIEVAVGLMLASPGLCSKVDAWLGGPGSRQESVSGVLPNWMQRAADCLAAVKPT